MYLSLLNPKLWLRIIHLIYINLLIFIKIWWYGMNDEYAKQLKSTINRSGPVFIKISQWLLQRRDMINSNVFNELKSLQISCKEYPIEVLKKEIENELSMFSHIDEKPLGVGSIAQVHKATLKNGDPCVIKIRHPYIVDMMRIDLTIIKFVSKLLRFKYKKIIDALDIDGVLTNIYKQAFFRTEYENLEQLRYIFRRDRLVKFPQILYVQDNIIVEEQCPGNHIDKIKSDRDHYISARYCLFYAFTKMIRNKFVHGDLHDGNVLYHNGCIYIIDYGIVLNLSQRDYRLFKNLIRAYGVFYKTGNCQRLVDVIQNFTNIKIDEKCKKNLQGILESCSKKILSAGNSVTAFKAQKVGKSVNELMDFFNENNIYFKENILYLLLTLPIIEADITNEFEIDFIGNAFKKYGGI